MQNPVFLKRYGYEEYLRYAPIGWLETFETAMREGNPEPYGDNCQKVYEFMTYPLDELIGLELSGRLALIRKPDVPGSALFSARSGPHQCPDDRHFTEGSENQARTPGRRGGSSDHLCLSLHALAGVEDLESGT
ncbi:MAG: hypothetical protein LRZ88_10825 [Candidatus Cloacimonetes bacterium]|nr:hypothetical protein [Candidatus Cloacimonadota bacterium]